MIIYQFFKTKGHFRFYHQLLLKPSVVRWRTGRRNKKHDFFSFSNFRNFGHLRITSRINSNKFFWTVINTSEVRVTIKQVWNMPLKVTSAKKLFFVIKIWRKNNVSFSRYLDFYVFVKSADFKICDVIISFAG